MKTDFGGETDNVYPALEESEKHLEADLAGNVPIAQGKEVKAAREKGWQVPPDAERKPRTEGEMAREAEWLGSLLSSS